MRRPVVSARDDYRTRTHFVLMESQEPVVPGPAFAGLNSSGDSEASLGLLDPRLRGDDTLRMSAAVNRRSAAVLINDARLREFRTALDLGQAGSDSLNQPYHAF